MICIIEIKKIESILQQCFGIFMNVHYIYLFLSELVRKSFTWKASLYMY